VQPTNKNLQSGELKEKLQQLRRTDDWTNLYYLVRAYLYLAAVIGGTVWFYHYQAGAGLSFWWNVPVTLLAIALVGAGQHQLTGLAHEAVHHTLLKNRHANDLVSDWFCMFPLFSSTHHYRLQHLAHHQFVNDPERDPDVAQLQTSGHWFPFPLSKREFLRRLLQGVSPLRLIRYIRVRALYSTLLVEQSPYTRKDWKPSKTAVRVGIAYIVGLIWLLTGLVTWGDPRLLALGGLVAWAGIFAFYLLIPKRLYSRSRLHPVISTRVMTLGRITFISALFNALAWVTLLTGQWAALWFFLLWVAPLFTSFSFFMILRQLVQHGNGGRGWLTNTRVFFVQRMIRFSVFPIGQDYHLPHHLFSTVPHYRLKDLHEALLEYPEYREQAVIVEGYFLPPHRPPTHPTVLDVLGPEYAPPKTEAAYIDDTVMEGERVEGVAS
jgi:fatty acid desaturase